jgi:hypothetical protein
MNKAIRRAARHSLCSGLHYAAAFTFISLPLSRRLLRSANFFSRKPTCLLPFKSEDTTSAVGHIETEITMKLILCEPSVLGKHVLELQGVWNEAGRTCFRSVTLRQKNVWESRFRYNANCITFANDASVTVVAV